MIKSIKDCYKLCSFLALFCINFLLFRLNTAESRFYESPREAKSGSKNRRVREIRGKITVFD